MIAIWTTSKPSALEKYTLAYIKNKFPKQSIRLFGWEGEYPNIDSPAILVQGTKIVKVLEKMGVVPKGRTLTWLRGKIFEYNGSKIMVGFTPDLIARDPASLDSVLWDAELIGRLGQYGSIDPKVGEYRYVDNFSDVIEYLHGQMEKGLKPTVSTDLETLGLNPYDPEAFIVSMSVTVMAGMADMIRWKKDDPLTPIQKEHIEFLLTDPRIKVVGANLKYDMGWWRTKWGIVCTNQTMDTTIIGSLLDENRSNSLNNHAKIYTDMGGYDDSFNEKYDKSRMDLVPDEPLLLYGGGDTDACFQVAEKMKNLLIQDAQLTCFYVNLLQPSSLQLSNMESVGITVDVDEFHKLREELTYESEVVSQAALNLIPNRIKLKYKDNLKLTRAVIIKEYLFSKLGLNLKPLVVTEKTQAPSTAMDHLVMFKDHPQAGQFIDYLEEYNSINKTLGTYVVGFLKHLREDGKLHPTAVLYKGDYGGGDSGTVTGRLAFKDPAIQTVPKHTKWAKKLRRCYIAPEGYTIIQWDYSQGELRIAADVANEPAMIEAYRQGIDLHMVTGARVSGYEFEDVMGMLYSGNPEDIAIAKAIRQNGKAGNFGLLYGMQAAGYQSYAKTSYGVDIDMETAHKHRDNFFELYSELAAWHTKSVNNAKRLGYVRSPLGRIRHLPNINSTDFGLKSKAERQSINSPVQATLSDMAQLAMVEYERKYGRTDEIMMSMTTHDSIVGYVRDDLVSEIAPQMKEVMETLPLGKFGWEPQLVFVADVEVGKRLSDLQEYKC